MNKKGLNGIGALNAFIGLALSFLLAIEYFGLGTNNIASSACSALGGADSCAQVAQSRFSAIPSVPVLGNVPIALFGFGFYGIILFLFVSNLRSLDETEDKERLQVILGLSTVALFLDIVLLGISIGVIGTVCVLCSITYAATIGILLSCYLLLKTSPIAVNDVMISIKKGLLTLSVIFLFSFSVGYAASKMATSGSGSSLATSAGLDESEIAKRLLAYETGPKLNVDISGSASIGNPAAPITIVKFADFNCGHCLHTSHILAKVLADYDGMVRVVYRNFPLDGSCNRFVGEPRPGASSCIAAMASICADKQGKFAEMYHGLYDNTEKGVGHTASTVLNLANTLSINTNKLKVCMSSPEAQTQLNKEVEEAGRLKINSTPALYINDKQIESGTPNPKFLKALLDKLISKL